MGKSLFEFASEKNFESEKQQNYFKEQVNEEQVKKTFDKYSKFSNQQLMDELLTQVSNQKKNGTFSFVELSEKINSLKPMLSEEQIKNIDNLLSQIK